MRVFTDGQTHLVLGPGGLAIHRHDAEPRLIALGPKPKRGAAFAPPRDVLAPLDDALSRVLVTLERDAWEVPLDGRAPRRLAARDQGVAQIASLRSNPPRRHLSKELPWPYARLP